MPRHHILVSKPSDKPRVGGVHQYAAWVEKGWIHNFMLVFGYPMTVFVAPLEDTLAAQDPCVYFETASTRALALCRRHARRRTLVHLGYFRNGCPFRSVRIEGRVRSIRRSPGDASPVVSANHGSPRQLRSYRVCVQPTRWEFSEFVGSSARNKRVRAGNFNVQRKIRYGPRTTSRPTTRLVSSPCDDVDDKSSIFTHKCRQLSHRIRSADT